MKRYVYLMIGMALILGWIFNPRGWAQTEEPYPTRKITYIICFDRGGQSDRAARVLQPLLEEILKQKMIIDYTIGGGGAIGWGQLARAKPDGYTMAGFSVPDIILQPLLAQVHPFILGQIGYKTEQIVPVAIFDRTPLALAVLKKSHYKTYQDFIDAARKHPGALTIGCSGTFSGSHMAALRLQKLGGADFAIRPVTGSARQMEGFLNGECDAIFASSDDLTRHKDESLVLAFATEQRLSGFPGVPTFRELNVDLVETVDRGAAVPPKTPNYIIKKLEAAFLKIAASAETQAEMKKQGLIPVAMGHDESVAYITKMTSIYKELVASLPKEAVY
ncbi:MAG TPA: tripartite tricarboxylate transporter substrate binding protein [Thermodesulfobacteriota bacterium]|nr:tripartite tricarboxylate transporter substrate binding protein [Thermodesulfobacteriota bacterium]